MIKYLTLLLVYFAIAPQLHANIDYKTELYALLEKFNSQKKLTDEELVRLIPKTENEFSVYYSLTSPNKEKKWNVIFSNIEIYIGKRASVSQKAFRAYVGLTNFVDGEYAEGYFDRLDFLIGKHTKYFCKIFSSLSSNEKRRLSDLYSQYCK
ncbi:hypothetical protein [Emticicia sp. 21SJ11W-3]|uniref:hypothetical protein n=1 Tax=Emticicia sp. 21SJ11W-3 TaxID=2916755 RepID=UPI0020A17D1D|nr:hypothetical protein [Emticicia sp. 21SJ11W-3]UTA69283.1 hypothetical protein MB380_05630 [Emticicia sp. 21SJ11W-3]